MQKVKENQKRLNKIRKVSSFLGNLVFINKMMSTTTRNVLKDLNFNFEFYGFYDLLNIAVFK